MINFLDFLFTKLEAVFINDSILKYVENMKIVYCLTFILIL